MNCVSCGKRNRAGSRHCSNCGAPLPVAQTLDGVGNNKKIEGIVIAVVSALVVILIVVIGAFIYKNSSPKNEVAENLNTAGTSEHSHKTAENVLPDNDIGQIIKNAKPMSLKDPSYTGEETQKKEIPSRQEPQTPQDSHYNSRLARKDEFLREADDIVWYSDNYLDMSKTQFEINVESGVVYEKWDTLLNEVYQYLKTIMPRDEFKELESDEIEWIIQKEKAIEEAAAEWEGGSGESAARNLTAIQYTRERCYYLISLIN